MSKLFIHFLSEDQISALKNAGHEVVHGIVDAAQHAEATVIASPVGSKIADAIHAIKDDTLTGAQKFERVLADAIPLIVSFATDGGVALIASAEDTARGVVQTIYNGTLGAVHAATAPAAAK